MAEESSDVPTASAPCGRSRAIETLGLRGEKRILVDGVLARDTMGGLAGGSSALELLASGRSPGQHLCRYEQRTGEALRRL
jgi:hypothetical protein